MSARFTFRRLEYFVAVGEAGSIAGASQKLNIAPPSISAAIMKLEEEFGMQLFARKQAHGLALTREGRRFFEESKKLLRQAGKLENIAADMRGTASGVLHVGCLQTVAPIVMPELRKSFEAKHPDARIAQTENHQAGLLAGLQSADLDMCLTYDLDLPPDICFVPLVDLPAYVMLPPSHQLSARQVISPAELRNEPLILLDLPLSAKYFLSMFHAAKIKPRIAERSKDMALVRSMVANGFGYSLGNIRPQSSQSADGKPLKYVPLKSGLRPMRLGLAFCRSDYPTAAAAAFRAHCRKTITGKNLRVTGAAKNEKPS